MGEPNAERQVTKICEDTIILKDTFHTAKGTVEKQKLVKLYPQQLTWTSTHLTGPNKHSQFLYKIKQQGGIASALHFTAAHLEYDDKADAEVLARRLCLEDAGAWKLLVRAMEKELGLV